MLTIKNVTIKDLKNHIFIENFNYSLGNQDKVAIIGEEGNGKSTFLKAVYDPKWIEDYMVMSGEIMKDFQHIGYLPQQLPDVWRTSSICEFLLKKDPDEEIPFERYNDLQVFETQGQKLHIQPSLLQSEQSMGTLSGGEKVKLQMLKLMVEPMDLLLLDEPTNDLDIHTLEWMETFLNECRIPVIFISHDITLLSTTANVIIHFEQLNHQTKCRSTVYKGNYKEYVQQRSSRRDKDIQLASKEKQEYIKKKIRLNDQRNALHDALNDTVRNPGLAAQLKRKMRNIKAQEHRFEREGYSHVDSIEEAIDIHFEECDAHESKRILELHMDALCIGERKLIEDVDLLIKGKDKIVITGDNGSGKSVLMKEIYRHLKNCSDIILGYMPQNYKEQMDMSITPIAFLMERGDASDITRCRQLLGVMKFTAEEMEHVISDISEGQKAKLFLLNFIKRRCNVLLLDEPTRNLSPLSSPAIIHMLEEFNGCMIAVSHDRCFIAQKDVQEITLRERKLVRKH